ncbi:MAG: hypothetical protein AB9897_04960 [Anaerolineaceae bacterium]
MSKRWTIFIEALIVLVALSGAIYVALAPVNSLMNWYNIDDAFYYYKVAQNVLTGHGSTFDGINLANGYHPLWMIICLGVFWLSKVNLILPLRALVIVSGLFNAAAALVLFRLLKKFIHRYAAVVGAMMWALLPAIYGTTIIHGMEAAVSAFFILLLLNQAASMLADTQSPITPKKMALLGLIGAFTMLARLDNVFIVAFVGFFVLFRVKKLSSALIYDWVVLSLAVISSWILRLGFENVGRNIYPFFPMVGIVLIVCPIVYYFFGMYQGFNLKSNWAKILRQLGAAVVNFILVYAISYLFYKIGILKMFSRSIILLFALISFVFILCLRLIQKKAQSPTEPKLFANFGQWIKSVLREGIAYALPIAGIIGVYCLFNKLTFGTFTPVSGQIKVWWGTLPNTVYSHPNTVLSVIGLSPSGNYGPWSIVTSRLDDLSNLLLKVVNASMTISPFIFILLVILSILLIAAIFNAQENRVRKLFLNLLAPALIIGCLFQIAYYGSIGYAHTRGWYWVGELIVVTLLASCLLDGIFTWLDKSKFKINLSLMMLILCSGVLIFLHGRFISKIVPMTVAAGNEQAYLAETKELEAFTNPGSKIGMTGGGMVAYFIQDRTIVNLDGLINSPEYFNAMKAGKATQFLDAIPLNYVYGNEYVIEKSDPYKDILKDRIKEIGIIRSVSNFRLYYYLINQ